MRTNNEAQAVEITKSEWGKLRILQKPYRQTTTMK